MNYATMGTLDVTSEKQRFKGYVTIRLSKEITALLLLLFKFYLYA
jgi:hypothetical protein